MLIEKTDKAINLYPKVIDNKGDDLKKLKRESLTIQKDKGKVVLIQRGFSRASRAKLEIILSKEDLRMYIQELQQIYDELDDKRLNTIR